MQSYLWDRNLCENQDVYHLQPLIHGMFLGLDQDAFGSPAGAPVALRPRDMQIYAYTTGVYGACSATCNGGMQYRSVECVLQDPVDPRAVDETHCIAQRLQRPVRQQACSVHPCAPAEYSVSSFSVCSVTCGEGQQTREVLCVDSSGERLADNACSSLPRPPAINVCRRPACHLHITWHCTRSCGGGVRERRVSCYDIDLNPYSEDRCGSTSKPVSVETCNTQPCPGAQNPRPLESLSYDDYPPGFAPPCELSDYGCCTNGHTSAAGPRNEGCPGVDCPPSPSTHAHVSTGDVCSQPRDDGPCDNWIMGFYYDSGMGKCTDFWYGGCEGNGNNFASPEACQRQCGNTPLRVTPPQAGPASRGSPR
ncbi:hypothetical protein CRUP_024758 [Coryphaenoides rupestris]|nr:hypothetical protein CRUP_024758 [Coryphaenoides rupestris]